MSGFFWFMLLAFWVVFIWLLIRIFRSSPFWAFATFFVFFSALVPLKRYWGHPQYDIRVPFFVTLAVFIAYSFVLKSEVDAMFAYYDAEFEGIEYVEMDEIDRKILFAKTVANITPRRGQVTIDGVPATINTPRKFRYINRQDTEDLVIAMALDPGYSSVGMIVHESVDLTAQESPWLVWVDWHPDGHLKWEDPAQWNPELLTGMAIEYLDQYEALEGYEAMDFQSYVVYPYAYDDPMMVWAEEISYPDTRERLLDCYAVKPGRSGYLLFSALNMNLDDSELCLRTVRLIAKSTQFDEDETYADAGWFAKETEYSIQDIVNWRWMVEY